MEILNCGWGSDQQQGTEFCVTDAGVVDAWWGSYGDTTSLGSINPTTEVIDTLPAFSSGKGLKKLLIDYETLSLKVSGKKSGRKWDMNIEFDGKGISAAKMKNYRRLLGCCGIFVYLLTSDGNIVCVGLDPKTGTGTELTLCSEPLTNQNIDIDYGLGSDENGTAKANLKFEGKSTYGQLYCEKTVLTPAALEALTV